MVPGVDDSVRQAVEEAEEALRKLWEAHSEQSLQIHRLYESLQEISRNASVD